MTRWRTERVGAAGLALLAAGLAIVISIGVFPYHSVNHDEGVYLQQAAMLLEGQLFLRPPVPEAFRPWFFVRDGARLYSKYAPVPAALFAGGKLLGSYRLALGVVAAASTGLTYAVVAELFGRRTGLLAAALFLASPLFLVQSGVFLPYLPTTVLNLTFALAYLRAGRTGSRRWGALSGGAIGLAFFARPYTAVLFSAPFVLHALWTLRDEDLETAECLAVTGVTGLAGVGIALAYNAVVTGSPFLFPYEAFAPRDGLGFGRRALLGYEIDYTPALALRANGEVLWLFFTRWVVAGPIGTVLSVVGLGTWLVRLERPFQRDDIHRVLLVGVAASVIAGNVFFWGNLNVLGDLSRPADGLVHHLGPYYHVDLLLPTVAFAAHGILTVVNGHRQLAERLSPNGARRVGLISMILLAMVGGGVAIAAAAEPISDNRAVTERLSTAYEPLERQQLSNAVVFLPTPHGDWLNHPFQALRNDPAYDRAVLYAIEERPFDVVDAFPDRSLYRYSYRGIWAPSAGQSVEPRLRELTVAEGGRLRLDAAVGLPTAIEAVSVRLASDDDVAYYAGDRSGRPLKFQVLLDAEGARLGGNVTPTGQPSVRVDDSEVLVLEVFAERPDTSAVVYRIELPIERGSELRAITPRVEVCETAVRCDDGATYVPGTTPGNVTVETVLSEAQSA